MVRWRGELWFVAGLAIYRWDEVGAPVLLRRFSVGRGGSAPRSLRVADDTLFFVASEGAGIPVAGLWRSDGTTAGTVLLHSGGPTGPGIADSVVAHGRL